MSGLKVQFFRIVNHDTSNDVYIGFTSNITTGTATIEDVTFLAEKLQKDSSGVWPVGRNPDQTRSNTGGQQIPLFCIAADAAGTDGVVISISAWGYK